MPSDKSLSTELWVLLRLGLRLKLRLRLRLRPRLRLRLRPADGSEGTVMWY